MNNTDTIINLATLGLNGDKQKLIDYVEELAAESSNNNKQRLNKGLMKVLNEYTASQGNLTVSSYDTAGKNDIAVKSTLNIWIPGSLNKRIEHFIAVHEDPSMPADLKQAYSRILLFGPPGSGKTTIGYYIAERLSIPIVYVKVSDVISSKFGETTRNIADIFAKPGRQLIFLDEFDAFGKSRYDSNDVGELKRIVNSLIQTLDFAAREKIVVGATNIIESIDPAIVRRFNLRIEVDRLDKYETLDFFEYLLTNHSGTPMQLTDSDKKELVSVFSAMGITTIDAIRNVFEHTVVNAHLAKSKKIGVSDMYATLLTSGHLDKSSMQKISSRDQQIFQTIIRSLSGKFKNADISSYAGIHRNSLINYDRKTKNAKKI